MLGRRSANRNLQTYNVDDRRLRPTLSAAKKSCCVLLLKYSCEYPVMTALQGTLALPAVPWLKVAGATYSKIGYLFVLLRLRNKIVLLLNRRLRLSARIATFKISISPYSYYITYPPLL